jgi:plastocyanin
MVQEFAGQRPVSRAGWLSTRRWTGWIALPLAAVAAVALAGCSSTPRSAGAVPTITVDVNDHLRFVPSHLVLPQGTDAIRIVNVGSIPHNLDIPQLGVHSPTVNGHQTITVTVHADKPGSYSFDCDFHVMEGMVGTLVVQPSKQPKGSS